MAKNLKIDPLIKNNVVNSESVTTLIKSKLHFFKDTAQNTFNHVQKNKMLDILGINDVNICVNKLTELSKKINEINENTIANSSGEIIAKKLQIINNDFSALFKTYGTSKLEDLLAICLGDYKKIITCDDELIKVDLLLKYFHPIGYKVIGNSDTIKDVHNNNLITVPTNFKCHDVAAEYEQFYTKVYGLKVFIKTNDNKNLIIFGIVDDVLIELLNNKYIIKIQQSCITNLPEQVEFHNESFEKFMASLSLKDFLIADNHESIFSKYSGHSSLNNTLKQKQISIVVKEFIKDDTYTKRNTLVTLLINTNKRENQYLAYLLYDLLSNDSNGNIDSQEQVILFDSFTWSIKDEFKQAMKKTVQYTNELTNYDFNKIPLEQQICLMNVSNTVKEKAMLKLKEVKAKSEDSGTKARQYLDGLLKIPFEIYKREPILYIMDEIKQKFKAIGLNYKVPELPEIMSNYNYTNVEIITHTKKIKEYLTNNDNIVMPVETVYKIITTGDKSKLIKNTIVINTILTKHNLHTLTIQYKNVKKAEVKSNIKSVLELCKSDDKKHVLTEISSLFTEQTQVLEPIINSTSLLNLNKEIVLLESVMTKIEDYMIVVKNTLNKYVHGHDNAKRHVERIIGQWINGNQSTGNEAHVLGFEGNPGIGKTTLAKGLSECLKDEHGTSRPFSLIAIGGDSNSSSLVGHSYTYVGSTWGQIVQILMDKKCMNPIILIDEVDKISKTEHGKEITGVLTHLLDPTQNKQFQDKYFSGIDLDLSKALFILSYNDPQSIDRIMLDRIHRIKFDSLSVEDKIIICNKHLLPDLYKKIGLDNIVSLADDVLKFIIEEYTLEPGVRKLKEKLFDIIGELNLRILKNEFQITEFPLNITIDDVKNKYFKDKREVKIQKIHPKSEIGIINALWANEASQGGVLPLQVSFIPSNKFLDLTLTGSLGDVMKESISVSLTNAWNLTNPEKQKEIIAKYNNVQKNEVYGLHVHCPSISTKKDGPSATTAFTVILYSLFNNIKIKNYFGITGETSFDYCLTEIGGLREKIIHSIPAGVKEFIYPYENQRDFDKIMEKYKDKEIMKGIKFHSIKNINEVFDLILEKD
jgi:ATP-dependent Lon protease/glutaredoxin-related protein